MDAETPREETMATLDHLVRSGKALYVGVSNYSPEKTREAISILKSLGTPLLIHVTTQANGRLALAFVGKRLSCSIWARNGFACRSDAAFPETSVYR